MIDLSSTTDEEIVRQIQAGETDFFGIIIDRYQPRLQRYARRFLSLPEDREDQLQEIFIKVFMNIQSFDCSQRFSPWIYRIAHNTFINEIRRRYFSPISFFDMDVFFPQFMETTNAENNSIRRELGEDMDQALGKIDIKYRSVLILFYYEGLSYQEIADVLQIPVATVGVRINRGKKLLKPYLSQTEL